MLEKEWSEDFDIREAIAPQVEAARERMRQDEFIAASEVDSPAGTWHHFHTEFRNPLLGRLDVALLSGVSVTVISMAVLKVASDFLNLSSDTQAQEIVTLYASVAGGAFTTINSLRQQENS